MQKRSNVLIAAALSAGLMSSGLMAADEKWYDKITATGYLAGGYQANLNGLTSNTPLAGRFDSMANQFDGVAGTTLSSKASMGDMGDAVATLGLMYGPQFAAVTTNLPVEQANVTLTHGSWIIKGGLLPTFLGTEVLDYPGNWNFGRGLLFGQVPFFHNGLSVGTNWEGLGIMGLVANSIGTTQTLTLVGGSPTAVTAFAFAAPQSTASVSDAKDYGLQLTYSMMGWNWTVNYFNNTYGVAAFGSHRLIGNLFNVLTNYQVMEGLNFAAEYLYKGIGTTYNAGPVLGDQSVSAKQQGYAAYLSYDLGSYMSGLSVAPRFEQWWTPDAAAGAATETDEGTLSLKLKSGSITHFLEYRHDFGNAAQFVYGNGAPGFNQDTVTVGGTFNF